MPKNASKSLAVGFSFVTFLVTASSSFLLIYLTFFQVGSVISLKRLALAAMLGLLLAGYVAFVLYRTLIKQELAKETCAKAFLIAALLSALLWLVTPIPQNYLFAPQGKLDITVQRAPTTPAGITQLTLLNDGMEYVPFRSVHFEPIPGTINKGQAVTLAFDEAGKAHFTWQGRAWKSIQIEMSSSQAIKVVSSMAGSTAEYTLAPQGTLNLTVPVKTQTYYAWIEWMVVLAALLMLWLILLTLRIEQRRNNFLSVSTRLHWAPGFKLFNLLTGVLFTASIAFVLSFGLQNRIYSDDYCSLAELHQAGYLNAVIAWFHLVTGRYSAHIFNYLAFEFPALNTISGPLTATLCIGGGLYALFWQLLADRKRNIRAGFSALFSLTLLGSVFLCVPYLYESFVWNIHSITVSAGFGFFAVAGALVLRNLKTENPLPKRLLWALFFFLWGVIGAGFNEVVAMLDVGLFAVIILAILLHRAWTHHKQLLSDTLAYFTGSTVGLVICVTAPGNSQRIGRMGFSAQILSVFKQYYAILQFNTTDIFARNHALPLLWLGFLLICAYFWGQSFSTPLPWAKKTIPFWEKTFLLLFPCFIYLVSFLPSAFIAGYFPERTAAIPLVYAFTTAFLGALTLGNAHPADPTRGQLLLYLLPIALLVLSVPSFHNWLNFSKQMSLFGTEWDARNTQIETTIAQGQSQVTIIPYKNSPGTDLSNQSNLWLTDCESKYYGIPLVVDDK